MPGGERAAPSATVPRSDAGPTRSARLAGIVVLLLGGAFGLHRLIDPDLFQQIAVGRAILADPRSLGVSDFIAAYPAYPYVEDKWLASTIVAIADRLGGADGVMLYQIALCMLVAGAWYRMQTTWRTAPAVAIVGTALGLLTCSFRLEPRPDTISHALLAVTIALVGSIVSGPRLMGVAAGLLALWINLHGYFVNGLLVLLAAAVAALCGDRDLDGRVSAAQRWIIFAVALAACLVHPQGWHAAWSPVQQLLQLSSANFRGSIEEFSSPLAFFRDAGVVRFAALAAAGVVALAAGVASARGVSTAPVLGASRTLSPRVPRASSPSAPLAALLRTPLPRQGIALVLVLPWLLWPPPGFQSLPYRVSLALLVMAVMEVPVAVREGRLFRPLLLVGFGFLAATVIRNIPLITPAALAILGPAWTAAVRELGERRSGLLARRVCAAVAVLVVMGTLWLRLGDRLGTDVRAPSRTGWGVDDERFPVGAVDALARAAPTGALLNNFDSGGYLLYRLHPGRRVFIAGNTSMYPPTFLEYYRANVTGADVRLDEVHRDHAVVAAIVDLPSATTRLVMALATDPAWRLAFFDRGGALFVRDGGAATDHPARAPLDVPTRVRELVATDDAAPGLPTWLGGKRLAFPSFNLGLFLEAIGRPDLAVNEALRIWPLAPDENVAVFGGRAAQACGRLVDFLTPLEEGSTRFPQNDAIRRLLFLALAFRSDRSLNGGALAEAAADLERMATLEPASCGPPYALAKIAVVQRDAARAERWLAAGRALDGDGTCGRGAAADPVLQPFMAKRP